jgi:hypothetical protein
MPTNVLVVPLGIVDHLIQSAEREMAGWFSLRAGVALLQWLCDNCAYGYSA